MSSTEVTPKQISDLQRECTKTRAKIRELKVAGADRKDVDKAWDEAIKLMKKLNEAREAYGAAKKGVAGAGAVGGAGTASAPVGTALAPILEEKVVIEPIEYLEYSAFAARFPEAKYKLIGSGTFGKVYANDDFVVKSQKSPYGDAVEPVALQELDRYATFYHPCIARPVAWSTKSHSLDSGKFNTEEILFAMPKGEKLFYAYISKKISLYQIAVDTLSAVAFLNTNGIAHCDLKPENVIFHEGRAKLIDFGLSQRAVLGDDGVYYITNAAYSYPCKDPEYIDSDMNSISCELYALGMTWAYMENPVVLEGNYYGYTVKDPRVSEVLKRIMVPVDERPTANELLKMLAPGHVQRGVILDTPTIPIDTHCGSISYVIMNWMHEAAILLGLKVRQLFLALHLVHRTLPVLLPKYNDDAGKRRQIQTLAIACLYLAHSCLEDGPERLPVLDFSSLNPDETNENVIRMMIRVMSATGCIISTYTYWDYAKSGEDLPQLLTATISCKYDPTYRPPYVDGSSSKDVRTQNVALKPADTISPIDKVAAARKMGEPLKDPIPSAVFGSKIRHRRAERFDEISDVFKYLVDDSDMDPDDPETEYIDDWYADFVAVIIYHRKRLSELPVNVAQGVYKYVYKHRSMVGKLLPMISKLAPGTLPESLAAGVHPFR